MWDSGKVLSCQSINVEYDGHELEPRTPYWWKVRTWDAAGKVSPYSEPQKFMTGRFATVERSWPLESQWMKTQDGSWFLENRQRAFYHEIPPKHLIRLGEGHYFADFGKAAFATLRLTVTNPAATGTITVYLGERKNKNNTVHKEPGVSNIGFNKAEIPLKKGKHSYTVILPRHISRYPHSQVLADHMPEVAPCRYVEITASPCEITRKDIRQVALFYYFDDNASAFTCADDRLNQVWDLCKYTLKAAPFLSLYIDGNRERMPYEGDAYIQQLGHYAVDREYSVARYTNQFLILNSSWPTEWQMHTVLMALADYMQTGNAESIERFYEELKKKTLIALAREDGLISTKTGLMTKDFLKSIHFHGKALRDITDWPAGTPTGEKQRNNRGPTPEGERDGFVFMPFNTVVNAFHYHSLVLMGKMAAAIGKENDSRFFAERASLIRKSFHSAFFSSERGVYLDGIGTDHASIHANMFPLAFDLVPQENVPSVVRYIKTRRMACSPYGAQYLLEALFKTGENRYAIELMTSESKRSWLNMIRSGSTMTTEAWDEYYKPNLGWNHAWGSAPANMIPRGLFGIEPLEPAFRKVRIKPQLANLQAASLKIPTIRGPIHCEWKTEGACFNLDLVIPANARAQVWVPGASVEAVREADDTIDKRPGIEVVDSKSGYIILEIEAGDYHFSGRTFCSLLAQN
jgi:hypothetical protein